MGPARRPLYPLFLDMRDRRALVVGGGAVAERRVGALVETGASVTVVAPRVSEGIDRLASEGHVRVLRRDFEAGDTEGMALVLSATGDPSADDAVVAEAHRRGALVNVADDADRSDFHVPAVERRGDIHIAVSTGGAAPGLAARLRDRFSASLGPEWERFARLLGEVRALLRSRPDSQERMDVMRRLTHDDALLGRIVRGEDPDPRSVLDELSSGSAPESTAPNHAALVSIVGAGPGEADLITVAGMERLRRADVVVYDDLVDRRLIDEAPRGAELVYHGKRGWSAVEHSREPSVLLEKARQGGGMRVVRLKGGDPSVFGRLDEEIAALDAAGIPYEIVPGITAASAAAAAARVSLTRRGVAAHVTLLTGVGAGERPSGAARTAAPLLAGGGTVALYMGHRRLAEFTSALLAEGIPASTPAVVVAAAATPRQLVVEGTVGDIAVKIAEAGRPAPSIALFGETVRSVR